MKSDKVHSDFCLNGISLSKETLKDTAYNLVKDGEPFEKAIGTFLGDWLDDSSTLEVQTSGSTSIPKRIVLQKQQMVNSALATGNFFDLKPSDLALLCLSADYIAGKMMLVRAMVLGLHLDYVDPSANPLAKVGKEYDFGAMVPLQLYNSIEQISCIKTLLVGGAPVSQNVRRGLKNVPTRILETYGMTETITHIAVKEISTGLIANRASGMFSAMPGVTFRIDKRNCLIIDAPKVANEQVITNDVVELRSKTEFKWLGRYDNVINSGGVKLHPEIIEEKLAALIKKRFFVVGVPDKVLGQKLILLVEGEVDSERLIDDIKGLFSIEKYEIPKTVYSLLKFEETGSGKVDRRRTADQYKANS